MVDPRNHVGQSNDLRGHGITGSFDRRDFRNRGRATVIRNIFNRSPRVWLRNSCNRHSVRAQQTRPLICKGNHRC